MMRGDGIWDAVLGNCDREIIRISRGGETYGLHRWLYDGDDDDVNDGIHHEYTHFLLVR